MKTIEIADARESLGQYVGHAEDLPIVVTDQGRPVAALLAVPNADMETVSLSTNAKFLSLIERSRERQGREGGISSSEMRRRLDVAPNNRIERDQ
jgi:antitoxin (DNA-binding transcriptional repressor) of toxin-antitoxin stability system